MTRSAMATWTGVVPAANYAVGRAGRAVQLIVDHWMDGTIAAAEARFRNPASIVSAHYGIGRDGQIRQWVDEADTAYQAGDLGVNYLSIGIEHEGGPGVDFPDALYAASTSLHADIAARYGFALVLGQTVKRHRDIVPTQCPGTLDVERIVRQATGGIGADMPITREQYAAEIEPLVKETIKVMIQQDPATKAAVAAAAPGSTVDAVVKAIGAKLSA